VKAAETLLWATVAEKARNGFFNGLIEPCVASEVD